MNETRAITISAPPIPSITEVESIKEICKVAAYSGFLTSNARRDDMTARTADAFFVVMYGRELGIPAMTALRNIYVINGKPSCSGELLLGLMLKGGVQVKTPDPAIVAQQGKAEVQIKRPGGEWRTYTFTREMAKAANLLSKDTWKSYEPQMMIWRAVSMGAKYECADLTGGMRTVEELAPDTPLDEQGAPVGEIVIEATSFPVTPDQPQNGHEPDAVRVEQPSAKVVGVQPQRNNAPTPPPASPQASPAPNDVSVEPDPLAEFGMEAGATVTPMSDEDPRVHHCDILIVNRSKGVKQYALAIVNSRKRIAPVNPELLKDLHVGDALVKDLDPGNHDLIPSWSVYAEFTDAWHIDKIVTGMGDGNV